MTGTRYRGFGLLAAFALVMSVTPSALAKPKKQKAVAKPLRHRPPTPAGRRRHDLRAGRGPQGPSPVVDGGKKKGR